MAIVNNLFDIELIREQFPVLNQEVRGNPLVYLDNSATNQKPLSVINAIKNYYENDNANIHRGVHELSVRATKQFEKTRESIKDFMNAEHIEEIIFVKGATDGINVVAQSYGRHFFQKDDEVIISGMEHHSNIVPWQMLVDQIGIILKIIPVKDNGELSIETYKDLFSAKTKFVSVVHASNALGTINPVKEMIMIAHQHGVPVMLDGAQAFPHMLVDVQALDCDFYVCSSHKAYGPTGVGVLYGKKKWLDQMPPHQGGGDMIESVTFEKTTYNKLPFKFEAGTPNIAGVIGFGAAIQFLNVIGLQNIIEHEQALLTYATQQLQTIPGLKIIGMATNKVGVISFVMEDAHPHDIGTVLDARGIAVRAGHHCAMPLMARFNVPATVRVSFGIYNRFSEIDALIAGLQEVKRIFG